MAKAMAAGCVKSGRAAADVDLPFFAPVTAREAQIRVDEEGGMSYGASYKGVPRTKMPRCPGVHHVHHTQWLPNNTIHKNNIRISL